MLTEAIARIVKDILRREEQARRMGNHKMVEELAVVRIQLEFLLEESSASPCPPANKKTENSLSEMATWAK